MNFPELQLQEEEELMDLDELQLQQALQGGQEQHEVEDGQQVVPVDPQQADNVHQLAVNQQ